MATLAKASRQLLLDAINKENGLEADPITLSQIGTGLPVSSSENSAFFNTYCTIYGLYGRGYHGSVTVRYRRYELEKMFLGLVPVLIDPTLNPALISDLLPLLNDQYGLALEADDIVDGVITGNTADTVVEFVAKPTNWAWLGSLSVRFAHTLPWIDTLIPLDTTLDAINPVLPYTDKPRGEYTTYGYDWTAISSTLTATTANAGQVVTQQQVTALQSVTNLKFTLSATPSSDEISLLGGVWLGSVRADSDRKFNSADFTFVNGITLGANSNYAGVIWLHYNV